ncbi:MAG: RluA family pseudouridine synthase [Buchnera aphidicola (Nurudea yanoniella)]
MNTKNTSTLFINIKKENIQQRIDNFLLKKFKKLAKNTIYKKLRTGQIRINKQRIKPQYKLQLGDYIVIPSIKNFYKKIKKIELSQKLKSLLINSILYEDSDLLILNKPPGMAVHSGSGINSGIIEYFRILRAKEIELDLVHRLDKGTSGVLILAKKRSILCELHKQLRKKEIQKKYLALVHGCWPKDVKHISAPLLKTRSYKNHIVTINNIHGKFSKTYFKIKKKYTNNTLMLITPVTGRTHQIRVHTQYINHPIVLDEKYGKIELDQKVKNNCSTKRLLLHANSITFFHPRRKKKLKVTAPIDKEFERILNKL